MPNASSDPGQIRDLIYFDDRKAASLLSQIEGGLPTLTQITEEAGATKGASQGIDIKLVKAEANRSVNDRTAVVEERVLHHALLSRLEAWLSDVGILATIDESVTQFSDGYDDIRNTMLRHSFAAVTGHAILQDYRELTSVVDKFNELVEFMGKAAEHGIKTSPAYLDLAQQFGEMEKAARAPGSPANQRAEMKLRVTEMKRSLEAMVASASSISGLPPWLPDGLKLFMDAFMRGRVEIRVQPVATAPEFEAISSLKRDCFVDADSSSVIYAYGSRPVTPLSVLGFITSAPSPDSEVVSRATRRTDDGELAVAFEQMFQSLEQLEGLTSLTKHPNVTLYPIAVYRQLSLGHLSQSAAP